MEKIKNLKIIHIMVIILGIIFILIPAFHSSIWFDESYSVAIANHSFSEIWTIGGNDVHPILYYWMLRVLNLIFGANIQIYRLFSYIPIAILAILGYTHIRKDFGEKTGIIFSFLILFFPIVTRYASEIRMYSWAMLFTSVMAIYAYRLYKNEFRLKNLIIFGIFSLCSAYTHYYGLMAAGIINIMLFIWLIKNYKEKKDIFIKFIITAIIQVILYIPWLACFLTQLQNVSNGFWISLSFPGTLIEIINVQFTDKLNGYITFGLAILLYIYLGYLVYKKRKEKDEIEPGVIAISIYCGIIVVALLISLIMTSVILLNRYLIVVTGLLAFFIAYFMAKEKRTFITICICLVILIMSVINNIQNVKANYDESNQEVIDFIEENIKENDLIIYGNDGAGFIVSAKCPENQQYFFDEANWHVEAAYAAYGPNMEVIYDLDVLEDYTGRIWAVNASNIMASEIIETYDVEVIEEVTFETAYEDYVYSFTLLEKGE